MYPKTTSETGQTGDTEHDGQQIKIEHDIVDKPVKPVNNLLIRLKYNMTSSYYNECKKYVLIFQ